MTNYYTADLHIGDTRIISLCERPFSSMNEMINVLRDNWNDVVSRKDHVYVIGDLAYNYRGNVGEFIDSLNGKKYLIVGNHDRHWLKNMPESKSSFQWVKDIERIDDAGRSVALCHYPLFAYDGSTKGGYHVYGHVHNNTHEPMYDMLLTMDKCFNAGVDVNNYRPVTLDEMIECKNSMLESNDGVCR